MKKKESPASKPTPKYPRQTLDRVLRIPKGILEQNAGKDCTDEDSAEFHGRKYNKGEYFVELNSALKYGLLNRPKDGYVSVSETAKKIIRPQDPQEQLQGYREAALKAPEISAVYNHYRGEYLPDAQFFDNALQDKFGIPAEKLSEFKEIFFNTLKMANLLEENAGKFKVLDVSSEVPRTDVSTEDFKKLEKSVSINEGDSCFIMMPFKAPLGTYYEKVYKPAIEKAGLKPVRADSEIFGTGKVMDQIWRGVNSAKVLVAELTSRNPNVFYELGLAHALRKPAVLVCSNEEDVPFDLKHIRVIFYDVTDPFWGQKLLEKVAENILSAIKNPEEAIFRVNE